MFPQISGSKPCREAIADDSSEDICSERFHLLESCCPKRGGNGFCQREKIFTRCRVIFRRWLISREHGAQKESIEILGKVWGNRSVYIYTTAYSYLEASATIIVEDHGVRKLNAAR